MKLNRLCLLFVLLMASTLVFSQTKEKEDTIEKSLSACMKKPENVNTAGMCDCLYKALDQWDKRLNTNYKALQSKLDTTARRKLVEAQREWVKFKEKEIELIDATIGKMDGTMWLPVRIDRIMSITKDRAIALSSLLDTITPEL